MSSASIMCINKTLKFIWKVRWSYFNNNGVVIEDTLKTGDFHQVMQQLYVANFRKKSQKTKIYRRQQFWAVSILNINVAKFAFPPAVSCRSENTLTGTWLKGHLSWKEWNVLAKTGAQVHDRSTTSQSSLTPLTMTINFWQSIIFMHFSDD